MISKKDLMSRLESEHRQWGDDYDFEQIMGDIEDFPECKSEDNTPPKDIEFTADIITDDPEGEIIFNHVSKDAKEKAEGAIMDDSGFVYLKSNTGEIAIIRAESIQFASFKANPVCADKGDK